MIINVYSLQLYMKNHCKSHENKGESGLESCEKRIFMNFHLYIQNRYAKINMVALYPSQSAPVSKKGLKIL